jgi:hypothetical protein
MLNFEHARLDRAYKDLSITLGSLVIPKLADFTQWFADTIGRFTGRGSGGARSLGQSIDGLRQSVDQNTATLRQFPGEHGGGPRSRNAIPGAFGIGAGEFLQQNLRSLSKKLGAYTANF